ncbi:MAG: hypothetical protein IJW83_01775 [Clostridia bacterium]|nr:hypothetical protein [Clostridia bacterium]
MKQVFAFLLCLCLLFSLLACSQVPPEDPDTDDLPSDETPENDLFKERPIVVGPSEGGYPITPYPVLEHTEDLILQPSPDIPATELITHIYTDEDLRSLLFWKGTLSELKDLVPIECVRVFKRKLSDDTYTNVYRIAFRSKTQTALLYFWDDERAYIDLDYLYSHPTDVESLVYTHAWSSEELESFLYVGQTYDAMEQLDPYGDFPMLSSDVISTHISSDGYIYSVTYGYSWIFNGWIVVSVYKSLL